MILGSNSPTSSTEVMTPRGVAVHFYWNGRVRKSGQDDYDYKEVLKSDLFYGGDNVNVMPMRLDYGITYSELLDKIYAITGVEKQEFELNIICRYPTTSDEYKPIPIDNDEAVQLMLEVPSRSSEVYCVELFLEKRALAGPKWEDLEMDCLVNVFQKVGMQSLLTNVPFVCKSWYKASLHPYCWQILIFPEDRDFWWRYAHITQRRMREAQIVTTALVKFLVDRSHGCVTTLELPSYYTEEALEYAANRCSSLKSLALPAPSCPYLNPRLISQFKNLEMLTIKNIYNIKDILAQISIHCNNFIKLSTPGLHFRTDEASIITSLPKIRSLVLKKANFIRRENLLIILNGCRDLLHLDVSNCIGFDEDDIQILGLASHIPEFICRGSTSSQHAGRPYKAYDSSDYGE